MDTSHSQALAISPSPHPSLTPNRIDLNLPTLACSKSEWLDQGTPSSKIQLSHEKLCKGTPQLANPNGARGPNLNRRAHLGKVLREVFRNRQAHRQEHMQPSLLRNQQVNSKAEVVYPLVPRLDLENRQVDYREEVITPLVPPGFEPRLDSRESALREYLVNREVDFQVQTVDPLMPPGFELPRLDADPKFECLFCPNVYSKQQSLAAHYNKHRKHPLRYVLLKCPRKPKSGMSTSGSGPAQARTWPTLTTPLIPDLNITPFSSAMVVAQPLEAVTMAPPHLRREWDPVLTQRPLDPSYVPAVMYEPVVLGQMGPT